MKFIKIGKFRRYFLTFPIMLKFNIVPPRIGQNDTSLFFVSQPFEFMIKERKKERESVEKKSNRFWSREVYLHRE